MTVVGRLWRRAPAFRVCLTVAFAATALAAMFPPKLPSFGTRMMDHAPSEQARYTPQPALPPPDYAAIDLPPLRADRSTLIPFAGRQLPLPAGKWVEVALARDRGPIAAQSIVLGRIQAGAMTGLILVTGTPPVASAAPNSPQANPCDNGGYPSTGRQDCWNTGSLVTAQMRQPGTDALLLKKSLDRLDSLGVILPARMAVASYARGNDSGSLIVKILLAEPGTSVSAAASDAANRRVDTWMRRWVPLLHRGFDGTLKPADVTAQLAHDPAGVSSPS